MTKFAESTKVPVERTKAELERTLRRYGADQIVTGWDRGTRAVVAFRMAGRPIRLEIPMPSRAEVERRSDGKRRGRAAQDRAMDQAERQRWRCLLLFLKARLEAVELGIETLDESFLPHIVLPGGGTVGERLLPEIERALRGDALPPLLPPVE